MAVVELERGPLRLVLSPDVGGSIAGLWQGGQEVLRSCDPAFLASPLDAACYPLLPYSNRLGSRRFHWQGRSYTTAPNFGTSPHSLHGVGWQRPWSVASRTGDQVVLALAHAGDADWPFAFEVEQSFALGEKTLSIAFDFTSRAAIAAPVGLGWHPFFPKRSSSRLSAALAHRWENDGATGLPARKLPHARIDARVSDLHYDDCFEGWSGAACIDDAMLALAMRASVSRLVVYTPDEDWYCVEPVSHVNNALNMPDPEANGLRVLQPGESTHAWMTLEIATASR